MSVTGVCYIDVTIPADAVQALPAVPRSSRTPPIMRWTLFPRDEQFFDLYSKMATEIRAAAGLLEQLLATDPPDTAVVQAIRDAEHRCDALTHDTIQRLHRTFVTPFDREDL